MLIIDTDIASAFAKAGYFDVLVKLFVNVGITPKVHEELLIPLEYGYRYPEEIFSKTELVTPLEDEQREYLKLMEKSVKMGKGEIECIVICLRRGYLFSSFDKVAISVARDRGVDVVVAGAIFKGLIIKGIATKEEVLQIVRDIETSDNRVLDVEW